MDEMEAQLPIEFSDRELAEAVQHAGDEDAFRLLYRRHTPRLLGFVMRILGRTEAEAETSTPAFVPARTPPGTVLETGAADVRVATGSGTLLLDTWQWPGGTPQTAAKASRRPRECLQ